MTTEHIVWIVIVVVVVLGWIKVESIKRRPPACQHVWKKIGEPRQWNIPSWRLDMNTGNYENYKYQEYRQDQECIHCGALRWIVVCGNHEYEEEEEE